MNWLTLAGLLARAALQVFGGSLAKQGITIDDSMIETFLGGLAVSSGVVWSIIQKHRAGLLEKK